MSVNIIYNDKFADHRKYLKKFGHFADKLVIVSPFLSNDMASLLENLPALKALEIYTNLDGYDMAKNILDSLNNAIEYCYEKKIDIRIWQNNMLHGKAYLLYRNNTEAGFIISSANYTMNGLVNNHEFGVFIDNNTLQQELYTPDYWCEIMPAAASKLNAIRKLKEMWNCTRVISFGDAVNDLPMFEASDECYAVANAVDELKAAATGIIESNVDDGVAKWLLKHVELR